MVLLVGNTVLAKKVKKESTQEVVIEVVDNNHNPVAGAIITIDGAEDWFFTDFNGETRISVPQGSKLTVTIPGEKGRTIHYQPAPEENGKLTIVW